MLANYSIKSLYPLALAEGEGVGTAYEYVAKRLVLGRWLKGLSRPGRSLQLGRSPQLGRVLIAGLPQKYGASLDFFLLAHELGAELTVVDEREAALAKAQAALSVMQKLGQMDGLTPTYVAVGALTELSELAGSFDLVISSEVLQRVSDCSAYVGRLGQLAPAVALFAPNADNSSHTTLSGLAGVSLSEMEQLTANSQRLAASGYIDMPPFPPGITRDEGQREQATTGRLEALAMWGLGVYVRLEWGIPAGIRRSQSHIVYGLMG